MLSDRFNKGLRNIPGLNNGSKRGSLNHLLIIYPFTNSDGDSLIEVKNIL